MKSWLQESLAIRRWHVLLGIALWLALDAIKAALS